MQRLAQRAQLPLGQAEGHGDRLHLGDGDHRHGAVGHHQRTGEGVDHAGAAADGGADRTIADRDAAGFDGGLVGAHGGGETIHLGLRGVDRAPGNEIALQQFPAARECAAGIGQVGLVFQQLGLGLGQVGLVHAGIEREQQVARLDGLAFLDMDGAHGAGDLRAHLDCG
ncbi:hypothetical protein D3C72_1392310 [compost metagenome]